MNNSKQYWTMYVRDLVESGDKEAIVDTLVEMENIIQEYKRQQLQENK